MRACFLRFGRALLRCTPAPRHCRTAAFVLGGVAAPLVCSGDVVWADAHHQARSSYRARFDHYARAKRNGQRYMRLDDFVRSLFLCSTSDAVPPASAEALRAVFEEADTGGHGLLSYPEYCLFMTLLTHTRDQNKLCFKMFDFDGTNAISIHDFKLLIKALCNDPSVEFDWAGGLTRWWFGPNGERRLGFKQFWGFVRNLKERVIRAEFRVPDPDCTGSISFHEGAKLLTSSLRKLPPEVKANVRALARLDADRYRLSEQGWVNVSLLCANSRALRQALDLWTRNGRLVAPADFRRACVAVVPHIELVGPEVDLLFRLFGEAATGSLEYTTMLDVFAERGGLGHPTAERDGPRRNAVQAFFRCMQGKEHEDV